MKIWPSTADSGSAADLVKIAMINVQKNLDASSLDAKLLLQVHDDLCLSVVKKNAEALMQMVRSTMESAKPICTLRVEVGVGHNWLVSSLNLLSRR